VDGLRTVDPPGLPFWGERAPRRQGAGPAWRGRGGGIDRGRAVAKTKARNGQKATDWAVHAPVEDRAPLRGDADASS